MCIAYIKSIVFSYVFYIYMCTGCKVKSVTCGHGLKSLKAALNYIELA